MNYFKLHHCMSKFKAKKEFPHKCQLTKKIVIFVTQTIEVVIVNSMYHLH